MARTNRTTDLIVINKINNDKALEFLIITQAANINY